MLGIVDASSEPSATTIHSCRSAACLAYIAERLPGWSAEFPTLVGSRVKEFLNG